MNSNETDNATEEIRFKDCIVLWKYRGKEDVQRTILLNVFDDDGSYQALKTFITIRGGLKKVAITEIRPYDHDHSLTRTDAITDDELESILKIM